MADERSGSARPTNHAMELIQIESRRVERRERLMRRSICHTQTLVVDGEEKGGGFEIGVVTSAGVSAAMNK